MWGVLARVEKWVCFHQICVSGCDLAAQWTWQDVCPQSRRWLQYQRPSQILQRALTPRAPLTADGWSVCATASAPSPLASLLATSSPCCCCCSTKDRSEEMSILWDNKKLDMMRPSSLHSVSLPLCLQIPLKDCSVYDPAFSPGERDVLRELGVTVLTENEVSCWSLILKFILSCQQTVSWYSVQGTTGKSKCCQLF